MRLKTLILGLVFLTAAFALFLVTPSLAGHGTNNPAHNIGDVLVIGDKVDAFIEKNPSQVVSMGAAEIERRNFLQVHEVLGSMPGVDVKQSASGLGSRIAIRGGGGSGTVLVLIDGRPAATMQYGGVDLSSIPIDIVQKITVFKPPVPVWLGPGSAAGVIYIETKHKKGRSSTAKKGKVRVSGGSYGRAAVSATGRFGGKDSQVMVSGGVSHKDGRRDNSDKDQGHLTIGYDKKDDNGRQLQINAKAFISDHGVAGPIYNPTPNADQRYEKASLDVKFKGYNDLTDYTLKSWADIKQLDETSETGANSKLDTISGGLGTDLYFTDDSEKNEVRLGAQVEHTRIDHTLSGKHERNQTSAHTEYTLRADPFICTFGGQAGYTNDFNFSPGGHAGVSYSLSENTVLKTNAGYSEHIPTFSQLYQPSHGAVDQVRGNPDLDKEKIVSLSAGLEHKFMEKHTLSLSLFRTETRDLIKYQRDSSDIKEPVNIDRAVKQGIETSIKFKLSKQTGIDISHVWQDTENKENNKELSYAPAHTARLILKTVFATGTRLEWTTRGYTDQFSDNENTSAEMLDAYVTTDVRLSHPVTMFEKKALVFANIHNLFDKDYSSHFGYPDDGFRLEVGMSITF